MSHLDGERCVGFYRAHLLQYRLSNIARSTSTDWKHSIFVVGEFTAVHSSCATATVSVMTQASAPGRSHGSTGDGGAQQDVPHHHPRPSFLTLVAFKKLSMSLS